MTRMFETSEITKLLDVLIGETEAVGETNEDERRLDNLKTLIDVTNWCLDGLQFAMASGYGRPEYSMAEISYTAQCALDEYGRWIADVLEEQMANRKTEPQANADQHIQHVESVEPTWTKEEHEAFYTFLWNVINPNEMQDYIEMFETKDEPQKWEKPPKFEHKGIQTACVSVPMALIEDEPQTERSE